MNQVTQAEVTANYMQTSNTQASDKTNTKKTKVGGAVIGTPELSDKAKKYYEQLKKKYSNMDFILVSEDKKEEAQANLSKYGNNKSLVVLIDEEKIEKMAEDPAYREKYEKVLRGATTQFAQMKSDLGSNADIVKSFGMKVNDDGTASFFAVVDKSLAAQKKRIEEKAEQRREDRKKTEAKEKQERTEEKYADRLREKDDDTVTVTASSWEELLRKINAAVSSCGDKIRTEEETWAGSRFDYSI